MYRKTLLLLIEAVPLLCKLLFVFALLVSIADATQPRAAIVFNSASGDDANSGLGPSPAVIGTAHTGGVASTTLTLSDATGIQVGDVIHMLSQPRPFTVVASLPGGNDVVVDDTYNIDSGTPVTFGCGDDLQTLISGTDTYKLLNDATNGAKPGWIFELDSGFTDSSASALTFSADGNTTNGQIVVRAASGFSVRPEITLSNTGTALTIASDFLTLQDISINTSGAGSGQMISVQGNDCRFIRSKFYGANATGMGMRVIGPRHHFLECEFTYAASAVNVRTYSSGNIVSYERCWNHDGGAIGFGWDSTSNLSFTVRNCVIESNGGDGIQALGNTGSTTQLIHIENNIFYGNTGSGVNFTGVDNGYIGSTIVAGNIFEANDIGIEFSEGGHSTAYADAVIKKCDENAFYNQTTSDLSGITLGPNSIDSFTASPFTDAANGDFSINTTAGGGALLRAATSTIPGP